MKIFVAGMFFVFCGQVFAQSELNKFLKSAPQRFEKIRQAEEKSLKVIESIWNIAQQNEISDPELAQFYYEMASIWEDTAQLEKIDVHRLLISEQSPMVSALKAKDEEKILKLAKEISQIDVHYREGENSYQEWFKQKVFLPHRFDESCSKEEQQKYKSVASVAFDQNSLNPETQIETIKGWVKKGELKISCLQKKTEYSAQTHSLSIRSGDSLTQVLAQIKNQSKK
ncbi:MAG: hypothetical protein Fur0010_24010 [Bdellovibrio sp.]